MIILLDYTDSDNYRVTFVMTNQIIQAQYHKCYNYWRVTAGCFGHAWQNRVGELGDRLAIGSACLTQHNDLSGW